MMYIGIALIAVPLLATAIARFAEVSPLIVFAVFITNYLAAFVSTAVVVVVLFFVLRQKPREPAIETPFLISLALSGALMLHLLYMVFSYEDSPFHDVTTDMHDPPTFRLVLAHRERTANTLVYLPNKSAMQRKYASDLQTVVVAEPVSEVRTAAENVIESMGWIYYGEQYRNDGTYLEATDRTTWTRFKDDIVVRLKASDVGTEIDVRSVSRVGIGDLGTNAKRIRDFLAELLPGFTVVEVTQEPIAERT